MENTQVKKAGGDAMQNLYEKGAHYGYSNSKRHPSMKPFIFGSKNNREIIDLEKTIQSLEEALAFVRELGKNNKQILFVGAKAEAKKAVKEAAISITQPYVTERWIGGMLTNHPEIKKRVGRLEKLEEEERKGELAVYTKKEQLLFDREMEKLQTYYGGIRTLVGKPDAVFVVDPKHESIAVKEALKQNIPIVALMNSDCDRNEAAYPIPANDASKAVIEYVTEKVAKAYQEGAEAK